jgi:putative ABC transport system ATP-binding protein
MNSTNFAITAQSLDKHFITPSGDTLDILQGVDLQVKHGEAVAIVGESGSGKTTLLSLLAGLDQPSAGAISLLGNALDGLDEEDLAALRRKDIGFVFQQFHLVPGMSALENVRLPLEIAKATNPDQTAKAALASVGLASKLDNKPNQLSGGEQQRVAIARAFATQPKVLFADEPTGNLDNKTGALIEDLLFELRQQHDTTLLLITHDATLAERCDRTLTLVNGRFV